MSMGERPHNISGLKASYFQHILDLSPAGSSSSSEGCMRRGRRATAACTCCPCQPEQMEECTCPRDEYPNDNSAPSGTEPVRPPLSPSDALAEEALGILSPAEKDELILQMHTKLRHLSGLCEEASTASEGTVARVERAHRDALREQMLSEQRLREELLRWRHHHPEVAELREENTRLRHENRQSRREYLAVLGKLARRKKLLRTAL